MSKMKPYIDLFYILNLLVTNPLGFIFAYYFNSLSLFGSPVSFHNYAN